jgi:hypothetical protein
MPDQRRVALRVAGVAGLLLALAVALRIPALGQPLDRDAAAYAAIGRLLDAHTLPYRDLFDHKQPLVHWIYAALDLVAPTSLAAIRVAAAVPSALAATLLVVVLRPIAGARRAALAAVLSVVLCASTTIQGTDLNTEHLLVLPAAATVLAALGGAGPFAVGLLGGVSVLAKAIGGLIALAALIPLLSRGRSVPATLLRFGAGLALPAALVAVAYAAAGGLGDLWFANLTYNERYVGDQGFALVPRGPEAIAALTGAALCCGLVRLVARRGRDVVGWTVLAWLAGAWLGAQLSGRGFPHYYVPLITPAVVLLVLPVRHPERALVLAHVAARVVAAGAVLALALPLVSNVGRGGDQIARDVYGPEALALSRPAGAVGALLRRRARPGDRLFVVGAEPEYYWRSGLRPYRRWLYDYPAEIAPERFGPDLSRLCDREPRFVVLAALELPAYAARCREGGYRALLRRGPVTVLERTTGRRGRG